MTDLAGRGGLGPKPEKQPKAKRKPLSARSKKRTEYMASAERKAGVIHMTRVARLGCLVCGLPSEVHHFPDPRSDMRVAPLCSKHHRREFGPGAFHYSPKDFRELHGSDDDLLKIVDDMLKALD